MQEYWSGLPYFTPGDHHNPGTEPMSPVSPALQTDSSLAERREARVYVCVEVSRVEVPEPIPKYTKGCTHIHVQIHTHICMHTPS